MQTEQEVSHSSNFRIHRQTQRQSLNITQKNKAKLSILTILFLITRVSVDCVTNFNYNVRQTVFQILAIGKCLFFYRMLIRLSHQIQQVQQQQQQQ